MTGGDLIVLASAIGAAVLAPSWSAQRRWLSLVFAAVCGWVVFRYLDWRLRETVLAADTSGVGLVVIWTVFLVELVAWIETAILVAVLLRRTDNSGAADRHEARLRAMRPGELPNVDVFIATYNEPLEVLEKTIAGALALDWPSDRLHVHVLDDGRRDWLAEYCRERGVLHLTREDNRHAKAGNINSALARTRSPFVLVLDADFVPLEPLLMRAIGFFDDPGVGIVQMPHHFFNSDPVQTSLQVDAHLPDEQRLFFDVIQPGRDGWNCAFCCGSNGILRRAAIEAIGGGMPTDSVTEDMLLTLSMLRAGYVTRYLNERLAIGLAPESLEAYFVQRRRWAQGAVQIMYLDDGPLGPGLRPIERILFLPTHWITLSLCHPVAVAVPAFFLLTGVPPIANASLEEILSLQVPAVIAGFAMMRHLARGKFVALSATAQSLLQALRVAPVVLGTLLKPAGHSFKVTPKGSDARRAAEDRFVLLVSFTLILLTGYGLLMNASPDTRIVAEDQLLPVVAFWAVVNMVVLLLVAAIAIPRPVLRNEERFVLETPCQLVLPDGLFPARTRDVSASGAFLVLETPLPPATFGLGDWIGVRVPGVGLVAARVTRMDASAAVLSCLGVAFHLPSGWKRDRLIQRLFSSGIPPASQVARRPASLSWLLFLRIFKANEPVRTITSVAPFPGTGTPPAWLAALAEEREPVPDSTSAGLSGGRHGPLQRRPHGLP